MHFRKEIGEIGSLNLKDTLLKFKEAMLWLSFNSANKANERIFILLERK